MSLDQVRKWINDAITEIENRIDALQSEQDDFIVAHSEWDAASGDPEPEEVDNEDEIHDLTEATNFLEAALDKIKED